MAPVPRETNVDWRASAPVARSSRAYATPPRPPPVEPTPAGAQPVARRAPWPRTGAADAGAGALGCALEHAPPGAGSYDEPTHAPPLPRRWHRPGDPPSCRFRTTPRRAGGSRVAMRRRGWAEDPVVSSHRPHATFHVKLALRPARLVVSRETSGVHRLRRPSARRDATRLSRRGAAGSSMHPGPRRPCVADRHPGVCSVDRPLLSPVPRRVRVRLPTPGPSSRCRRGPSLSTWSRPCAVLWHATPDPVRVCERLVVGAVGARATSEAALPTGAGSRNTRGSLSRRPTWSREALPAAPPYQAASRHQSRFRLGAPGARHPSCRARSARHARGPPRGPGQRTVGTSCAPLLPPTMHRGFSSGADAHRHDDGRASRRRRRPG